MSKDLVFIVSQKGGVGKSTFTRGLVEVLRQVRDDVSAYDADGSVGQLLQYLGSRDEKRNLEAVQDARCGVGFFDVRSQKQRGQLVNVFDAEPALAIVDLPGGSFNDISEVLGGTRKIVDAAHQQGYRVFVVLVITQVKAGVYAVQQCINSFGPDVHYVVAKNLGFANAEDFVIFDGLADDADGTTRFGKAREALLAAGGEVITLPKVPPLTYGLLDVRDCSFTDGATKESGLAFQQREHCKIFLAEFREQIASCKLGELLKTPVLAGSVKNGRAKK
jgi:hypothetical protein